MRLRRQLCYLVIFTLLSAVFGSCIIDDEESATPTTTSPDIAAVDPVPSTMIPAPTVTPSPTPTATATATVTAAPTITVWPTRDPDVIPSFEILRDEVGNYPAICTKERVLGIFQTFIERFNAGDLEGAMAMIADEDTEGEWRNGPENITDKIPFQGFGVSSAEGQAKTTAASSHDELRALLQERFESGEQLKLLRVIIGPTWDRGVVNPMRTDSDRNVAFGAELEQWSDTASSHKLAGKGLIDCLEETIVMWGFGPGQIGDQVPTIQR